jgi:hypothetical protein
MATPFPPKLTPEQRKEICDRFVDGELQKALAAEYGVCVGTITKVVSHAGAKRARPGFSPVNGIAEFASRAKSKLWRADPGADKTQYDAWVARVAALQSEDGGRLTHSQAIVRASKEFPCLTRLFREYDVSEFDPNPESHPQIQHFGKLAPAAVVSEGKELSYRDSLRWAIDAAGAYLRTGKDPETCPCDAAWYLYRQAIEEPKDFLAKVGQVESKGDGESTDKRNIRKAGQRSIAEIDSMLSELEGGAE